MANAQAMEGIKSPSSFYTIIILACFISFTRINPINLQPKADAKFLVTALGISNKNYQNKIQEPISNTHLTSRHQRQPNLYSPVRLARNSHQNDCGMAHQNENYEYSDQEEYEFEMDQRMDQSYVHPNYERHGQCDDGQMANAKIPSRRRYNATETIFVQKPQLKHREFCDRSLNQFFKLLEYDFNHARIKSEEEKFHQLMRCLNEQHMGRISSKLHEPKQPFAYKLLKDLLIATYTQPMHEVIYELMNGSQLQNLEPRRMYEKLLEIFRMTPAELSSNKTLDSMFREIFLQKLPDSAANVVRVYGQNGTLEDLVTTAERALIKSEKAHRVAEVSVDKKADIKNKVNQVLEELLGKEYKKKILENNLKSYFSEEKTTGDNSKYQEPNNQYQVTDTSAGMNRFPQNKQADQWRQGSNHNQWAKANNPRQWNQVEPVDFDRNDVCWSHRKFGNSSRRCIDRRRCTFKKQYY